MRRLVALVSATALVAVASGCGGASDPVVAPGGSEVTSAKQAAECVVDAPGFDGDVDHVPPASAPPAAELYDERPAIGGQHFAEWLEAGTYDAPIEERAAVHNLEHGAVVIYHDPDLDGDQVAALIEWADARNQAGLLDERTGAGLLVAPWEETLDPPLAFRAWGVTADCRAFEAAFADGFVRDHFGSAGEAPEGSFGGDPGRVVGRPADV